ncbi:MAG: 4Fe-4S binding protein, partial [Bacteroidales bacterium]|nr:4Fe-4S binding protein [Bacteroidales bacterium]
MQENLSIAVKESCIKCGRCVKVCPSGIFEMEDADGNKCLKTVDIQRCIACGHCSAACPVGAVDHTLFPTEKIHRIDYSNMPSPEQVMLLCKARRTNRAFSKEPVAKEHIDMILEAAHRAPTARNMQN